MRVFLLLILCSLVFSSNAQWAEEILKKLTIDEKIGQLCALGIYFPAARENFEQIKNIISQFKPGWVIFLGSGTIDEYCMYITELQKEAKIPLGVMLDGEWGINMRITDAIRFPRAMTLGAVGNNSLITALGCVVGKQCRALGIHVNLAPVADVNAPENPVIHMRSFGEYPELVGYKAAAFAQGLKTEGVLSCAKHFPGHGDTTVDSHLALPKIGYSKERLDTVELVPFKYLIKQKIPAIMTGHLEVPALDSRKQRPASLSYPITTDLLRKELGFEGIIITDGLDMKGVTNYYKPGIIEREAFLAGADILLIPQDISATLITLRRAIEEQVISLELLDQRVLKILQLKEQYVLNNIMPNKLLLTDTTSIIALKRELYKQAVTLVYGDMPLITNTQRTALVQVGGLSDAFSEILKKYLKFDLFKVPLQATAADLGAVASKLDNYESVIYALFPTEASPAGTRYGMTNKVLALINEPRKGKKVFVICGTPYLLHVLQKCNGILVAYEDEPTACEMAVEALIGNYIPTGVLPIKF